MRRAANARALAATEVSAPAERDGKTAAGSPRWWGEFHQAFIAVLYWLMTWPAWTGRQIVGGPLGSRAVHPHADRRDRRRQFEAPPVVHVAFLSGGARVGTPPGGQLDPAADWLFVASLAATGILSRRPFARRDRALAVAVAPQSRFSSSSAQRARRHSGTHHPTHVTA